MDHRMQEAMKTCQSQRGWCFDPKEPETRPLPVKAIVIVAFCVVAFALGMILRVTP